MNKLWLCAMTVMVVSGCVCTRPCEKNSDCDNGGVCSDTYHFCVTPTDGGSDGGQVGPGDGGKIDAGRDSGVLEPTCPSPCAAWESCEDSASGPLCRLLKVSFERPADGDVFDAGETVQFVIRARTTDGGETGKYVPLTSSYGSSQMAVAGNNTPVTLPTDAGSMFTFTAGWANASHAAISISARYCAAALQCQSWEECIASPTGGACTSDLSIQWQSPAANTRLTAGQSVGARVTLSKADGGSPRVASVPVNIESFNTVFTCVGASCSGMVTLPAPDGTKSAVAGWSGGPTASLALVRDSVGPTLGLVLNTDGGAQQRDAIVAAVLTSNEALSDAGLTLQGAAISRAPDTDCPNFTSVPGAAACFVLDLSKPSMPNITGGIPIEVSATDLATNSSLVSSNQLAVTRVRWSAHPTDSGVDIVQALAVGSDGQLFVGFNRDPSNGYIHKLDSLTGRSTASISAGSVQSISVTPQLVYYAANAGAGGSVAALNADNLTSTGLAAGCAGAAGGLTYSGIALGRVQGNTISIGSINGTLLSLTPKACIYDAVNGSTAVTVAGVDAAPVSTVASPTTATGIVFRGGVISVLNRIIGSYWRTFTVGASTVTPLTSNQLGTDIGDIAAGQALSSNGFVIGGNNATARRIFLGRFDGGLESGPDSEDTGVPAITSDDEGYVGRGSDLVRFNPQTLDDLVAISFGGNEFVRTSPVLGRTQQSGQPGWGYAVSNGGTLMAFRLGASTQQWTSKAFSAGQILTHPTLDCNRAAPASKTGVLYVGASDGTVKAIIVDSPGLLDTPGAWPKYQRSAGNAGNDDTADFPTNWPGCP